jgi:hypothetical protein
MARDIRTVQLIAMYRRIAIHIAYIFAWLESCSSSQMNCQDKSVVLIDWTQHTEDGSFEVGE